jgi:ABC-2 type transport system permease protein
MKRYLQLYREFLRCAFSEALTYRINFVLLVLLDIIFFACSLAGVDFIFDFVPAIGPWDRDQFMLFVAFMLTVDHLHMTFISEGFWNLSFEIRTGKLDFILLKPVWTWFPIFFRMIRVGSMISMPLPWLCLYYFAFKVHLNLLELLSIPLLVLLAISLLVSIEILISMSMFWTIESWGINFLRLQIQQVSRWPDFTFRYWFRKMFSIVIPVLLVGSMPVRWLLGDGEFYSLILLIAVTVLVNIISVYLWRIALRRYESASS